MYDCLYFSPKYSIAFETERGRGREGGSSEGRDRERGERRGGSSGERGRERERERRYSN